MTRHSGAMTVVTIVLMVAGFVGLSRVPTGFVPIGDQGYLLVGVQLPDGASLQRTDAAMAAARKIAAATPGVLHVLTVSDVSSLDNNATLANAGVAYVVLKDWSKRGPSEDLLVIYEHLTKALATLPEATAFELPPPPIQGIGNTGGFTVMAELRDGSQDFDKLQTLLPLPYRVSAVRRETADVVDLDLVPEGGRVPGFAPGQFNMIYAFGVGEVPISLSGNPADTSRFVHTVRAVGAVSEAIAGAAPGTMLGLRGPFGSAWPVAAAVGHDVLMIAGGLGLAPLRPAVYQVLAESERFGRITLLYGGRGPGELLFRNELSAWQERPDISVAVTVDHADPAWRARWAWCRR